ncbi:MAG TPA: MFS transporter [Clostridia bacterium]|nr:MFS transporter [Clostridia bacterium]
MRKEFFFVCTAVFLVIFGTYLSGTLLVPFIKTQGGTSISIGIIYSCLYVVRLLFGTPIGRISQKRGAKTILTYSLILYPFIAFAYWISWNIPSLLAARLLNGIASAMMFPMAMAYIGEISPAGQEGRFMGIYNTILFVASASGPFVGGLIYDKYGIRHAFLTFLILALSSLIIILAFTKNDFSKTFNKATTSEIRNTDKGNNLRELLNNNKLLALSCINIVTAILIALLGASFTLLALSYNLSMGLIGLLIALNNIVIGITQVPLGHFVDRCNKFKLTVASGLLTSILVLFLPLVKSIWGIAVLIAVLGIFTALNLATSTALSAVLGKKLGMCNTMGFLNSANSAGTIVGYLVLGWIADIFGINNTFYFTGIVFLVGTVLFYKLWTIRKP